MIFNMGEEESHKRIMLNFIFNAHTQDVRDEAQHSLMVGREELTRKKREIQTERILMLFSISQ